MKTPGNQKRTGSSATRPLRARAEEPRFLGPALPLRVNGRAGGHGAPRSALSGLLRAYMEALGFKDASVTLRLVGPAECRALNRRFRALDRSTDVLSFPAGSARPAPGFKGYLGDLALCPAYAWRRRGRFDPDFGAE